VALATASVFTAEVPEEFHDGANATMGGAGWFRRFLRRFRAEVIFVATW